jgi:hypothetical protein
MLIKRTCPLSGIEKTLDIPVTQEQINAWASGMLIQKAMPHLTADEREFILTGLTADAWDALFNED